MDLRIPNEYIKKLAEKWLNGTITVEEEKIFTHWYNQFNDEAELQLTKEFADDADVLKERIFSSLNKRLEEAAPVRRMRYPVFRLAAAVCIAGILTAGLYIYIAGRHQRALSMTKTQIKDVPPGGNKAILTLANGKSIVLDSLAKGKVLQQGVAQLTKTSDGRIAYAPAKGEKQETEYNELTVPRGGHYQLGLPDGTQVWLNSASSIRYPTAFAGGRRQVQITGEAYFEVARNTAMPFEVTVNDTRVEVLGTHFNINAYADEAMIRTTLLEGSVRVSRLSTGEAKTVKPGQQAELSANVFQVETDIDPDQVMAWKKGFFELDNADLKTIMRQLSRWYDVDVSFEGEPTGEKFGGRISRDLPLSKVLELLEQNNVRCRLDGRRLTVVQ